MCAQEIVLDEPVDAKIEQIPSEDREILSKFFKRLFYHGDFSYTLLGQKPMGSVDYNLELIAFPQFYKEPEKHLFLMALDEEGWEIWEKYRTLFPTQKYQFIKMNHDSFFGFLLINKDKAHAIIEKNLPLFQELIGEKICTSEILSMLCNGDFNYYHSRSPYLTTYYKALGLLYGYGEESAEAFSKREQLIQKLKTLPPEVMNCLETDEAPLTCESCELKGPLNITSLASDLKTLLEKNSLLKGTKKDNPFLPIKKSLFWGREECPHTQVMIENYDNLDNEILRIFEADNFLETVLELLTS